MDRPSRRSGRIRPIPTGGFGGRSGREESPAAAPPTDEPLCSPTASPTYPSERQRKCSRSGGGRPSTAQTFPPQACRVASWPGAASLSPAVAEINYYSAGATCYSGNFPSSRLRRRSGAGLANADSRPSRASGWTVGMLERPIPARKGRRCWANSTWNGSGCRRRHRWSPVGSATAARGFLFAAAASLLLLGPGQASAQTTIDGYAAYGTGGCEGRNELGTSEEDTVQECADLCSGDITCVSFEYEKVGTTCQRSSTCDHFDMTVNDPDDANYFYLKSPGGRTPSAAPSSAPSISSRPSSDPSGEPSAAPSSVPSAQPSSAPTALDSDRDGKPDSADQVSAPIFIRH